MKKESAASGPNALMADTPRASSDGHALAASPYKSAVQELDALRKTFRAASQHFAKRIDMEIIRLRERIAGAGEQQMASEDRKPVAGKVVPGDSQLYDLRDMITLLRTLDVKPLAGRRKDLKKIESLVDELRMLIERWE